VKFLIPIYALTAVALIASACASRDKTVRSLRVALKRFLKVAPSFLVMLVLVAVALNVFGEEQLKRWLAGENRWAAAAAGLGVGAISIMPGFIAFPLCAILRERGALFMVLSAFSTSLMIVGVVTFPLERAYLGVRLALARNAAAILIAAAVALATGLYFGEILWTR
jgi:uncharacterized membrane protein YraQ (UPF0718 family)